MIEETRDLGLIRGIFVNQYDELSDDGSADENDFYPPEAAIYLIATDSRVDGAIMLHAHNSATLEAHICMRKHCRGKSAIKHGRDAVKWVFQNTNFHKIIINVPSYKRHVRQYAYHLGFQDEGVNRLSFLKNGKLYDQYLLGISRLDTCHQQQQS